MRVATIILGLCLLLSQRAISTPLYFSPFTLQATGNWRLQNAYTLQGSFHAQIASKWALGIRYSHWLGDSTLDWGGQADADSLALKVLGLECGYRFGNPRMHYFVTLGAGIPLQIEVVQQSQKTFRADTTPLLYEARFQTQLKFMQNISWILEGGYRLAHLGVLKSGNDSYMTSGAGLDLSGAFLGSGLGIHF